MPNFALVKPKDVHQPFGLTCTFDCVRGAKHVVTRQAEGRAPAFMNLGLRRSFIKRRSNLRN